ncbi:NUDIX domain-containing protein [Chloroflexota bacterium]
MPRHTRYQGAIVRDHSVLLLRHRHHASGRTYWVFPGGGLDEGETEEQCVTREMKEETDLEVLVERLLFEEPYDPNGGYKWRMTFLCHPVAGDAKPGYEPEEEASAEYSISEVRWFDLRDESSWDDLLVQDSITYPQIKLLKETLGLSDNQG